MQALTRMYPCTYWVLLCLYQCNVYAVHACMTCWTVASAVIIWQHGHSDKCKGAYSWTWVLHAHIGCTYSLCHLCWCSLTFPAAWHDWAKVRGEIEVARLVCGTHQIQARKDPPCDMKQFDVNQLHAVTNSKPSSPWWPNHEQWQNMTKGQCIGNKPP